MEKRGSTGSTQQIRTQLAEWRRLSSREVGVTKGGTPFYTTAPEPPPTDLGISRGVKKQCSEPWQLWQG